MQKSTGSYIKCKIFLQTSDNYNRKIKKNQVKLLTVKKIYDNMKGAISWGFVPVCLFFINLKS